MKIFKKITSDCKTCNRVKNCSLDCKNVIKQKNCDMLLYGRHTDENGKTFINSSRWVSTTKQRMYC